MYNAKITNLSEKMITELVVGVLELQNKNSLLKECEFNDCKGGELTYFKAPLEDGFKDGVLGPKEFVNVSGELCLKSKKMYGILPEVFGNVQ